MYAHRGRVGYSQPTAAEPNGSPPAQHAAAPDALRPTPVAGLTVGPADDPAERRADAMAETALARLQRLGPKHEPAGQQEHDPHASRSSVARRAGSAAGSGSLVGRAGGRLDDDTTARIERRLGAGAGLPGGVLGRMQGAFGASLTGVRVHHDQEADRLNTALSAQAFTVGRDIFFAAGRFDPADPAGEAVLAHELAHVLTEPGSGALIRRTITINNYRGDKPMYVTDETKAWNAWKATPHCKQFPHVTEADVAKAFAVLNVTDRTYDGKSTFGEAMRVELETLGADLTPAPTKVVPTSTKVVIPPRPIGTTGPILRAAVEDTAGPGTGLVDLTRAELHALSEDRTRGRLDKYVADHAFTVWKRAETQANKGRTGPPVDVPLTLQMIRDGKEAYAQDTTIDKSPELPPRSPGLKKFASEGLKSVLPTMHANDGPAFDAVDDLLTNRITTELMESLSRELTVALIALDSYWMALKPKGRAAIRDMITNVTEFAGLRGAIGEVNAAWYAAAVGRTDVSVSNDKYFDPDVVTPWTPEPGWEYQDVDVAANTETERFFTEAKYDMGTFLAKASETVEQAEIRAEEAERARQDRVAQQLKAKSSGSATGVVTTPTVATKPKRPQQPRTTGPERTAPAQLHRYERAAARTKSKPLKKAREKRLEVYIANSHDWLRLFAGHKKLLDHLQAKRWRVVVTTQDVMDDADRIKSRLARLIEERLREHKAVSRAKLDLDPWLVAMSAAIQPKDFVTMAEEALSTKSAEVFAKL
jgi:hypothetical protein